MISTRKSEQSKKELMCLLNNLGYDVTKEERKVFIDVVEDALDYLEKGYDSEELYELLNSKKTSPIYVELAYFDYEKGMRFIHDSLESFQDTRIDNSNEELIDIVFESYKDQLDPYNSAFCIVNYLSEQKKATMPVQKIENKNKVKCKV